MLPDGETSGDARPRTGDVDWLDEEEFVRIAVELAEHGADWDPGRYGGRWSLAGAQPKIALHRDPETSTWGIPRDSTPTTHIVKPSLEAYADHHVNEALCLTAARETGLAAATSELLDVAGVKVLVSHRYDRMHRPDSNGALRWVRLHQEDLCQALAVHPSLKYQSDGGPGVADIGGLLGRLPLPDRRRTATAFLRALVFNVLIGGTDAHAKNYSLLLRGDRVALAPLYDVASAACYPQHQRLVGPMKIGSTYKMLDIVDKDWEVTGRRLGLPTSETLGIVEELREIVPLAFERAVERLPEHARDVAADMAERIVAHVQRRWKPDLDRDARRLR